MTPTPGHRAGRARPAGGVRREDKMPPKSSCPARLEHGEGSLGEWLKHDGDRVEAGEIIFTVEGDKAVQEIEALDSGILAHPARFAGAGPVGAGGHGVGVPGGAGRRPIPFRSSNPRRLRPRRWSASIPHPRPGPPPTGRSGLAPAGSQQPQPSARARRAWRRAGGELDGAQGQRAHWPDRGARRAAGAAPADGARQRLARQPGGAPGGDELGVDLARWRRSSPASGSSAPTSRLGRLGAGRRPSGLSRP